MSSAGRTVLITGASAGIGLGLAREMLARGDRVLALQRRPSPLAGSPGFDEVLHDVASFDATPSRLGELLRGVTHLDQVVLNAAIASKVADLADTPLSELRRAMDVNTWANKVLLDALFGLGISVAQVIGISSGAAVSASRGWNGYALSKAAFIMLLDLYAAERPETHFSSLAPGIVHTRMQDDLAEATPDELRKFPSLERLLNARGTSEMPSAELAAPRLLAAFDKLRAERSGAFVKLSAL